MSTERGGAESPAAARAFETYWSLGGGRTLEALAAQAKRGGGPALEELEEWAERGQWGRRIAERERQEAATAEATRQHRIREAEGLLAQSGLEFYTLVVEQLRGQLEAGKVSPALVTLLAQARSAMLRGLRLPERITQQVNAEQSVVPATPREGGTFDFAAFAQLFLALAGRDPASAGAVGADGAALPLGAARPDA